MNNNSKKKLDVLTGAAKCVTTVALCGMIVGSCALRMASIECGVNHSAHSVCPITKLETVLFGIDAGMMHQVHDLEKYYVSYPDHKEYVSDVVYYAGSDEEAPRITYNEVFDYGDIVEMEARTLIYVDGQFVQELSEDLELKKR